MPKFRKQPVVVEARQFTEEGEHELLAWINLGRKARGTRPARVDELPTRLLVVPLRQGNHVVRIGDWIICDGEGEFHPCPQEVFVKTYEEVQDAVPGRDCEAEVAAFNASRPSTRLTPDGTGRWVFSTGHATFSVTPASAGWRADVVVTEGTGGIWTVRPSIDKAIETLAAIVGYAGLPT